MASHNNITNQASYIRILQKFHIKYSELHVIYPNDITYSGFMTYCNVSIQIQNTYQVR